MYSKFCADLSNNMPKYVLKYFDGRGRGEPIRLVFAAAGVPYEDVRISDWPKEKPLTPYGTLPILFVDDKPINQSMAIVRYLANEYGLAGSNAWEKVMVDEAAELALDLFTDCIKAQFSPESEKEAALKEFKEKKVPEHTANIEKVLERNKSSKSGFLVGDKLSYADLYLLNVMDFLISPAKVPAADFSKKLNEHRAKVAASPKIAAYLKTRKETPF